MKRDKTTAKTQIYNFSRYIWKTIFSMRLPEHVSTLQRRGQPLEMDASYFVSKRQTSNFLFALQHLSALDESHSFGSKETHPSAARNGDKKKKGKSAARTKEKWVRWRRFTSVGSHNG